MYRSDQAFGRSLERLEAPPLDHALQAAGNEAFSLGYREKGVLQPATSHQEFRVLRRVLNVAVRKKLLPANPCSGVEFPFV